MFSGSCSLASSPAGWRACWSGGWLRTDRRSGGGNHRRPDRWSVLQRPRWLRRRWPAGQHSGCHPWCGASACGAACPELEDKIKATAKDAEGQLQAAAGDITGDDRMKAEGEAKQIQSVQQAAASVGDAIDDLAGKES